MARTKTCQQQYFTTTVAQISLCLLFTFAITQAMGQLTFNVTDRRGGSIFYVNDDGKIGIGTPDPQVKTHILESGTAGTPAISGGIPLVVQRNGFNIHAAGIGIISGRDSNAFLNFGDTDDDNIGQILYKHGLHNHDFMQFKVNNGIRLTIGYSGSVGIGALPDPTYKLLVNGRIYADGWVKSDRRLKQNIMSISNPLSLVMQLRGVSYQWRVNEQPELDLNVGTETGLIAQEVMAVLPGAVSDATFRFTDEEGFILSEATYYTMSYRQIIPVLVEAIKEQQAIIDSQRTELEALQTQMTAVEAALQQLGAWPSDRGDP